MFIQKQIGLRYKFNYNIFDLQDIIIGSPLKFEEKMDCKRLNYGGIYLMVIIIYYGNYPRGIFHHS